MRALVHRAALVELTSGDSGTRILSGAVAVAQVPVLQISSPKPGETLTLPTEISYAISESGGGEVHSVEPGLQLEVFVTGADGSHVVLQLLAASGTVALPDAKDAYLVGRHSLTFRLVNSEAAS